MTKTLTKKQEKAVAVAKDVISQLRKPKNGYEATTGVYVDPGIFALEKIERLYAKNKKIDLRDCLPTLEKGKCQVCALGSTILSKARLYDNIPLQKFILNGEDLDDQEKYYAEFGGDVISRNLRDIFSPKTIALIETAFERSDYSRVSLSKEIIDKAIEFGEQYDDSGERLKAIMENVIANNGTFKP